MTTDDSRGVKPGAQKSKVPHNGVASRYNVGAGEPFRFADIHTEASGIPLRLILSLGVIYLIVFIVCLACTIRNVRIENAAEDVKNLALAVEAHLKWNMYLGSTICALFYSLATFTIVSVLIKLMPMMKPSSVILAPFKKKLGLSSESSEDCREFVESCIMSDLEKCGWEGIVWYAWAALLSILGVCLMFKNSAVLGFLVVLSSGMPISIGYLFALCVRLCRQSDILKRMQNTEGASSASEKVSC